MSGYYLFTDKKTGEVIDLRRCAFGGIEAATHRKVLSDKLKKEVVSWCHMGGANPVPVKVKKS